MAHNVEIKARAPDFEGLRARAMALADGPAQILFQEDLFFYCDQGRLKLRIFGPDRAELIAYLRPDQAGPKSSDYEISATSDPVGLAQVLKRALGLRGVVGKKRTLLLVGQTRIHLDEVENLGCFVELEVVLEPDQTAEQGQQIAHQLMLALGIREHDLVQQAYIDLLEAGPASG